MTDKYSEQRLRRIVREIVHEEISGETSDIRRELIRQGGLLEDLYDKVSALAELVSSSLKARKQIDNHEDRLGNVETAQVLIAETVRAHSQQLKNA